MGGPICTDALLVGKNPVNYPLLKYQTKKTKFRFHPRDGWGKYVQVQRHGGRGLGGAFDGDYDVFRFEPL